MFMSEQIIEEINEFINSEESQDSKQLIDNFISYNDSTVKEINLFIDFLQDFEDDEDEQDHEEESSLSVNWEETKNEIACVLEDSGLFIGESFRRKYLGNGISILIGVLKEAGTGQYAIHSFKFDKRESHNWTLEKAKDWIDNRRVIDNSSKLHKNLKFVQIKNVKIKQVLKDGTALRITGIALSEGEWNGVFYPAEELEKSYKSLEGKPLRIVHSSSSRDIVGKVIKSVYNPGKNWIEFEAIVTDEDIAQKLLDKLIDSVSVGVLIDSEEENGRQVARNLEFKELSLVDDPACKDAKLEPVNEGGDD